MFNNVLDSTLEKTLSEIMKLYDGHGGHVTVFDVDPLILEELKRRDYLKYLDFNLSGNAVVVPSYKAIAYKFNQNEPFLVSTRRSKVFETFTESYTRVKSIGNGGAGTVFEVESTDGERYALKLLNAEATKNTSKLKRFIQEARFEHDCKCKSIVNAIDFGCLITDDGKQPFYVMPLMSGSLANLMSSPDDFTRTILVKMFLKLLNGLRRFYLDGNYHRDVKPQVARRDVV